MELIKERLKTLLDGLEWFGGWLAPLALRLLLAREFWDAGMAKLQGENGFVSLGFPFPFNLLSSQVNWQLATWLELLAAVALVLGLGTRFFALALSVLILVAIYTVHAGHGYNLDAGGWKLPLLYLLLCLPLLLNGPGKLSLDHVLRRRYLSTERRLWS